MSDKMLTKMNHKGVTLVEVMVSMVILLVVFMGLLQASLLSINHNLRNAARDEAVRIAAESMSRLRSFNYACDELANYTALVPLIDGGHTNCGYTATTLPAAKVTDINFPQRSFRNLIIKYTVEKRVDILDANTKKLAVQVRWWYPDDDKTLPVTQQPQHTIYYTMRNPAQ